MDCCDGIRLVGLGIFLIILHFFAIIWIFEDPYWSLKQKLFYLLGVLTLPLIGAVLVWHHRDKEYYADSSDSTKKRGSATDGVCDMIDTIVDDC